MAQDPWVTIHRISCRSVLHRSLWSLRNFWTWWRNFKSPCMCMQAWSRSIHRYCSSSIVRRRRMATLSLISIILKTLFVLQQHWYLALTLITVITSHVWVTELSSCDREASLKGGLSFLAKDGLRLDLHKMIRSGLPVLAVADRKCSFISTRYGYFYIKYMHLPNCHIHYIYKLCHNSLPTASRLVDSKVQGCYVELILVNNFSSMPLALSSAVCVHVHVFILPVYQLVDH